MNPSFHVIFLLLSMQPYITPFAKPSAAHHALLWKRQGVPDWRVHALAFQIGQTLYWAGVKDPKIICAMCNIHLRQVTSFKLRFLYSRPVCRLPEPTALTEAGRLGSAVPVGGDLNWRPHFGSKLSSSTRSLGWRNLAAERILQLFGFSA